MSMRFREYLVLYRPDVEVDLSLIDREPEVASIMALRVESWKSSYAFFSNANDLKEPTVLIPIDLVREVRVKRIVPPGEGSYGLKERKPAEIEVCADEFPPQKPVPPQPREVREDRPPPPPGPEPDVTVREDDFHGDDSDRAAERTAERVSHRRRGGSLIG